MSVPPFEGTATEASLRSLFGRIKELDDEQRSITDTISRKLRALALERRVAFIRYETARREFGPRG